MEVEEQARQALNYRQECNTKCDHRDCCTEEPEQEKGVARNIQKNRQVWGDIIALAWK